MASTTRNEDVVDSDASERTRITLWTALTGFSIVVLADIASTTKDVTRSRADKWALTVASISLSLAFLAILAHLFVRSQFSATPVEGGLITLCLGFWAAALPSIMNPSNAVAVGDGFFILHANTYFFSWGSFALSLVLAGSFARQVVNLQRPENMSRRALWWYALCATSFIVMSIASRTYHVANCSGTPTLPSSFLGDVDKFCSRVKFGIALGVISGAFTLLMGTIALMIPLVLESFVALLIMIAWCFGVGFITFGASAAASTVGNFYFSMWASFIISLFLMADAISETYQRWQEERGGGTTTTRTVNKEQTATDPQSRV